MISENHHTLDVFRSGFGFEHDLRDGSVMVESCEAGDVLFGDVGVELTQNVSIGVGRVCDNDAPDGFFGSRECFGLFDEDFFVHIEKIFSLHTFLSGKSSNEDNDISVFEHFAGIGPTNNLYNRNYVPNPEGDNCSHRAPR